ncbi:hypothetical protein BVG79_01021 [Ketogulonicigenium robustum]|uniref:Uncharacterized protein n=1 Tax=Ketogulonicigenium robustum TaxID=92947 RepID=A0A1W6NZB3_9RHOB|nr:hypothetical protein [Ketogulonicigenium robustum]ARO14367.1 hypothetical protein BVG79_01021 [Ketogulonicigenium robustum]
MPQTLASHDDYLITYHPVQDGSVAAGPLVITFGGFMADLKPHGFGTSWCRASG